MRQLFGLRNLFMIFLFAASFTVVNIMHNYLVPTYINLYQGYLKQSMLDAWVAISGGHDFLLPLFFWIVLGVLAYLCFYALSYVYSLAFNDVLVWVFYLRPERSEAQDAPIFWRRIFFHATIIVTTLLLILFVIFVAYPGSRYVSAFTEYFDLSSTKEALLSLGLVFAYWLAVGSLLAVGLHFLNSARYNLELEEEHSAI